MKFKFIVLTILLALSHYCVAQESDSTIHKLKGISQEYISKVDNKLTDINEKISKKTLRLLKKLQMQDKKISAKFQKLSGNKEADDIQKKYSELSAGVNNKISTLKKVTGNYNSYLDTLEVSLSFLKKYEGFANKVKSPLESLDNLKTNIQHADKIKKFIRLRKQQMMAKLAKFSKVPSSLKKQLERYSRDAYYANAKIQGYKAMLKDPKKTEKQAIALLREIPVFKKFMKENSQLASLFGFSNAEAEVANVFGLQTRIAVQAQIQQQISMSGGGMQQVSQNLAQGRAEMNNLKDKLIQLGGGNNSDVELPDFKPNTERMKPFLKRLEYSTDVQFAKSNKLFSGSTMLGLGVGLNINKNTILGIGASYNLGLGSINHIRITSEGVGLRGYFDKKLKKQLFLASGFEWNYFQRIKTIDQLKDQKAWQKGLLLGISKRYRISAKVKGEFKFMYDHFAKKHLPKSSQFVFRTGYRF